MFRKQNDNVFEEKTSLLEKLKRFKKIDKKTIKNRTFLKRGSYSFIITVLTLAVIVLINFVVSTLNKKIPLEYDLSSKKTNSISEDNKKYLKSIDDAVTVTVCSKKEDYILNIMSQCEEFYNVSGDERILRISLKLLEQYDNINDKIKVKYVDMQSVDFSEISQKYSSEKFYFGDILVTSSDSTNKRFKHLTLSDIYALTDTTGYSAYGYTPYVMDGNKLETALTSAINYVLNKEVKTALIYKGHSTKDYSSAYKTMLESNNYTVETSSEQFLDKIDDKYDCVIILSPSTDFMENEIDALSAFLDNGGNYGKGLIIAADALNPELPALYDFLAEWGIEAHDGILLETNQNALPKADRPTAMISFPTERASYTKGMTGFITGYNVPLKATTPQIENVTAVSIASTLESAVKAPAGITGEWSDYTTADLQEYDTVIEAKLTEDEKSSYVFALSSVEFISSDWAESSSVFNKDIVLAVTDRACGKSDSNVSFIEKSIANEGYTNDITDIDVIRMRRILLAIPAIIFICGIIVFIMRRNAK